jgi:hypothetical protein
MPTRALTRASLRSSPRPVARRRSADWKQAAYPTANSCSGFVPGPPEPPISFGTSSSTSSRPSLVAECPSRPPVAVASAVYRISGVSSMASFLLGRLIGRLRFGGRQSSQSATNRLTSYLQCVNRASIRRHRAARRRACVAAPRSLPRGETRGQRSVRVRPAQAARTPRRPAA